jgi:hypothetical protein
MPASSAKPFLSLDEIGDRIATDHKSGLVDYLAIENSTITLDGSAVREGSVPGSRDEYLDAMQRAAEVLEYSTGFKVILDRDGSSTEADITLISTYGNDAYMSSNGSGSNKGEINDPTVTIGHGWFSSEGFNGDSYGGSTATHELAHAMGLHHPGEYNFSATYDQNSEFANDHNGMSIMSYFSGQGSDYQELENTDANLSYFEAQTLMMGDLIAMDKIYGDQIGGRQMGNTTHGVNSTVEGHVGDIQKAFTDTLGDHDYFGAPYIPDGTTLPDGSYIYNGYLVKDGQYVADVEPEAKPMGWTVVDDGGYDTLDFSTDKTDQNVEFFEGGMSDVYSGKGNVGISIGSTIEHYIAGSGNDKVVAGDQGVKLEGRGGNDELTGGAGNDEIYGGTGDDALDGGGNNGHIFSINSGQEDHVHDLFGSGADELFQELKAGENLDDFDILQGNSGSDTFMFRDLTQVKYFNANLDKIIIDENAVEGLGKLSHEEFVSNHIEVKDGQTVISIGDDQMTLDSEIDFLDNGDAFDFRSFEETSVAQTASHQEFQMRPAVEPEASELSLEEELLMAIPKSDFEDEDFNDEEVVFPDYFGYNDTYDDEPEVETFLLF